MQQIIILTFINGATMMGSLVASLFFYKFKRATNDRFFALFSLSFLLLAVDRIAMLMTIGGKDEASPAVYVFRFLSFMLIIAAVVDKNRVTRRQDEPNSRIE